MPTRFIVLTYNRPRALQRLLVDLREEGASDVVVYDDGSTAARRGMPWGATAPAQRAVIVRPSEVQP